MIYPKFIKKGGTIGITAPSAGIGHKLDEYIESAKVFKKEGYKVKEIEDHMASLNGDGFDACIASGGGRMYMTMDRYESDWSMVKRGWDAHVFGIGRKFNSALEAIDTYQKEDNATDQLMHEFVICENDEPVGLYG